MLLRAEMRGEESLICEIPITSSRHNIYNRAWNKFSRSFIIAEKALGPIQIESANQRFHIWEFKARLAYWFLNVKAVEAAFNLEKTLPVGDFSVNILQT